MKVLITYPQCYHYSSHSEQRLGSVLGIGWEGMCVALKFIQVLLFVKDCNIRILKILILKY